MHNGRCFLGKILGLMSIGRWLHSKFWEICSELDKEIIRRYGFTLLTGRGVNVGLDFCFEKYVNLVRDTTGKVSRAGIDQDIEHAGLCRVQLENTQTSRVRYSCCGMVDISHVPRGRHSGRVMLVFTQTLPWYWNSAGFFTATTLSGGSMNSTQIGSIHPS